MLRIILIFLLIIAIGVGVYLVGQRTNLLPKAAETSFPGDVLISNVTDTSFNVSWFTPEKAQAQFISYGENQNNLDKQASDDRDNGTIKERYTHYVTLKELKAETTYYFKIGQDSSGKVFKQNTAKSLTSTPPPDKSFFGTAKDEKDSKADEGVIYLLVENGQLLSSPINQGFWAISLSGVRNRELTDYLALQPENYVEIFAQAGLSGQGYTKVFGFAKRNSLNILLTNGRVPFFGIKLGNFGQINSNNSKSATSSTPGISTSPSSSPISSPASNIQNSDANDNALANFFNLLWSVFTPKK